MTGNLQRGVCAGVYSGDLPEEQRIAIHQAGHAWAYVKLGRSIIYATIRARKPRHDLPDETPGLVLPSPRIIDPYSMSLIAAAGPIAETAWQIRYQIGAEPGRGWDEAFSDTLRASGHGDKQRMVPELLNSEQWITVLRADIEDDFDQIQALANQHRVAARGSPVVPLPEPDMFLAAGDAQPA